MRRVHRHRGVHGKDAHQPRDRRYSDEVFQHVIRQLWVEVRIGDERLRIHHDRIAVGRALRDDLGADHPGRAGPVVDRELLVELLAHFLKHEPRYDIGRAAGRKHDDNPHRLRRVRLRPRRAARTHDEPHDCAQQSNRIHAVPPRSQFQPYPVIDSFAVIFLRLAMKILVVAGSRAGNFKHCI